MLDPWKGWKEEFVPFNSTEGGWTLSIFQPAVAKTVFPPQSGIILSPILCSTLHLLTAGHILPRLSEGRSREQKVWVREGSSAVLPCHLRPKKMRGSSKQLPDKISVLWKRHGDRYTRPLTHPASSVHQDPHVVLEVGYSGLQKTALSMKPRVSLQDSALRNGNFSLRIDPVRSEDVGLYEDRAGTKGGLRSSPVISAHTPSQHLLSAVTLSPPNPVIENELLLMSCNSSHRASLVETCWFHNEHLGPTSRTFCFLPGVLSIFRPSMSDAGSWRCQLRYSDKEIISATYNLRVLGELSLCVDTPASPTKLPCSLSHLPSTFRMNVVAAHWSHLAGGHLQDWDISQNLSSRSFPLHLPVVGLGDAGQYRCTVSVGHRKISRNVTLAVVRVIPSIQGPGKLAVTTPRSLEEHSSQMGPTLEIPQVSQKDTGTWECSVYGPEGRLGAVDYDLQITGTLSCGSANNLFFSPFLVLWCPFLSQPHPVLLPLDHLDLISLSSSLSFHQFLTLLLPVSWKDSFLFCLVLCSPSLSPVQNRPSLFS
uniref:Ig-like domain-containing protein n=1 Tax=Malurus cyaneus samueli TaxID=2593467 RepID=A0A8C5TW64_9PASS